MRWKQILISSSLILGFILLIIFSGAALLPENLHVQKNKNIAANDSLVQAYFKNIDNWPEILPWLNDTFQFTTQILNQNELIWKNHDGNLSGRLLLYSHQNNINVQLIQPGKPLIIYNLYIHPKSANLSRLEWVAHAGEFKGLKRWNYFMIRDWVRKDLDKSLQIVPDIITNSKIQPYNLKKTVTQFESARFILIHKQLVKDSLLLTTINENWKNLLNEIQENNWKKTDVPYFYFEKTTKNGVYMLETGHPFTADSADIFPNQSVIYLKADTISFTYFRGDLNYIENAFSDLQKAVHRPLIGKKLIACLDTNITQKKISSQTRWVISQYHHPM